MENLIKVFEYSLKEKDTVEWLFKLLEEEKIPYKEELKEKRLKKYYNGCLYGSFLL